MGLFGRLKKEIRHGRRGEPGQLQVKSENLGNSVERMALNHTKQLSLTDDQKKELVSSLTVRERDIYFLLIEGFMLKEIAKQLNIKYSTANTHMTGVYRKLNVNTRAELIINYRNI